MGISNCPCSFFSVRYKRVYFGTFSSQRHPKSRLHKLGRTFLQYSTHFSLGNPIVKFNIKGISRYLDPFCKWGGRIYLQDPITFDFGLKMGFVSGGRG